MPTAAKLLPDVPAPAAVLGLAGVVPFAASALGSFWLGASATAALLAYGAVILSFLGGIHWGLAIGQRDPSYRRLGLGVVPSLVGWAPLLLGGAGGLLLLAAAFVAVLALDFQLSRGVMAPAWFPRLRTLLTVAVVLCLLVAVVS
jgi:hypothetical protein